MITVKSVVVRPFVTVRATVELLRILRQWSVEYELGCEQPTRARVRRGPKRAMRPRA
jgi:hypothetical protein